VFLLALPYKQASLLAAAVALGAVDAVWTLLELESFKCSLFHYSAAVRHTNMLVSEFKLGRLMGTVSE
jgi:hypothetical protein